MATDPQAQHDPTHRVLSTGEHVFDPRGTVTAKLVPRAPRLVTLSGVRLAVLDNSKWNASRLLRQTVSHLSEAHGIGEVTTFTKESFSRVAPAALVQEIVSRADAVVTAIGD
jgi:hypothetical protein